MQKIMNLFFLKLKAKYIEEAKSKSRFVSGNAYVKEISKFSNIFFIGITEIEYNGE